MAMPPAWLRRPSRRTSPPGEPWKRPASCASGRDSSTRTILPMPGPPTSTRSGGTTGRAPSDEQRIAAADIERLAGHEGGVVRAQVQHGPHDVVHEAETVDQLTLVDKFVDHRLGQVGHGVLRGHEP